MSEEWALEGLAKSNLGSAVLTSEAAAKEEGGLDWVADMLDPSNAETPSGAFNVNGFCSECQCLQSPALVADATFAAEMGAGTKLFLKDIKIFSFFCYICLFQKRELRSS